jgi:hypothetical protein
MRKAGRIKIEAISKIGDTVLSSSFSWLFADVKPAKAGTQNRWLFYQRKAS